MKRRIYLDMDGTIANLYEVENWLADLKKSDPRPYIEAKPMVKEEVLADLINKGYELAIVSWLAKNGNEVYNKEVRKTKKNWLKIHYPEIKFEEIHIVKYGTPKSKVVKHKDGILIDDEKNNRKKWKGTAINPKYIW